MRKRNWIGKAIRGVGWGLGGLLALVLIGFVSYPLWDGYGPWLDLPAGPVPASQSVGDERFSGVGQRALEALRAHRARHRFPALTAAVAVGSDVVWVGAVGWADVEEGTAASGETVLRIGSTSKAVTATAFARLMDQGVMSLDVPLSQYIDDLPHPAWKELTPRQLLSHTAGFPEYRDNPDRLGQLMTLWGGRRYSSVRESLEIFDGGDLLYEPGTSFAYSSFDVNLLGAAMAAVEERPFLEVLDRRVFEPLGLVYSGGDSDGEARPGLAKFYESDGERVRTWRSFDLSQRWPGGGLVSTSAELARIGGSWTDPTFVSVETRDRMWTPQVLSSGEVNEQSYALGWRYEPDATHPRDGSRPLPFAHHGGISKGAMSWLVVYPDVRLSIAININTRAANFPDFNAVEREIATLFLVRIEELEAESG